MIKQLKLFFLLAFITIITFSCIDICEQGCNECIELKKSYTTTINSKRIYHDLEDDKVISLEVIDVVDRRSSLSDCSTSTGGWMHVIFKIDIDGVEKLDTLISFGCAGDLILEFETNTLATMRFDNYIYHSQKIYPLSAHNPIPLNLREYEFLFTLSKK